MVTHRKNLASQARLPAWRPVWPSFFLGRLNSLAGGGCFLDPDAGFYPDKVEPVSDGITRDQSLKLTFKVKEQGLDVGVRVFRDRPDQIDTYILTPQNPEERVESDAHGRFSVRISSGFERTRYVEVWVNRTHRLGWWRLGEKKS